MEAEEPTGGEATRSAYAIRCIVVTTQSAVRAIGRAYPDDPVTRERLQGEALARGQHLLDRFEADQGNLSLQTRSRLATARGDLIL